MITVLNINDGDVHIDTAFVVDKIFKHRQLGTVYFSVEKSTLPWLTVPPMSVGERYGQSCTILYFQTMYIWQDFGQRSKVVTFNLFPSALWVRGVGAGVKWANLKNRLLEVSPISYFLPENYFVIHICTFINFSPQEGRFEVFFGRNQFTWPNNRLPPIACLTYPES